MNYHFIAIGGSAMHNLALALHKKGEKITGSDDEIFEPSRSRLAAAGLLPQKNGWFANKITKQIDAVVLGMHAKSNNPELLKAKELGIKIYSYPEFLYNQTINKKRVVIGGSHGKTTTTAMVMHVLANTIKNFDYMVGAKINGFDTMVNIDNNSEIAVFEGDEYLTSPIDTRPKFHLYKPHIALITGIAWDHVNVFPTFDIYIDQFRKFIDLIEPGGTLIYCANDKILTNLVNEKKRDIEILPYFEHNNIIIDGKTYLQTNNGNTQIGVFGGHNLQNLSGAKIICSKLGITDEQFYQNIATFTGADKRLQLLSENKNCKVFLDFAHSPSKLKATIDAVAAQYPDKQIIACMELHTYSSLSKSFLLQYKHTMQKAHKAIVFYSKHAIELKQLPPIDAENITNGFDKPGLIVENNTEKLKNTLLFMEKNNTILLLLSSGNFGGINLNELATQITQS